MQIAGLVSPPVPPELETEADARIARMVAERLERAARRSLRAERAYLYGSLLMIACALPLGCALPSLTASHDPLATALGRFLALLLFLPPILTYGAWMAVKPHFDADEITRVGGVKAVVPLIAMLQNTLPPNQERAVFTLLTLLLPRMKASDASLLTLAARQAIHSWLPHRPRLALQPPLSRQSARCGPQSAGAGGRFDGDTLRGATGAGGRGNTGQRPRALGRAPVSADAAGELQQCGGPSDAAPRFAGGGRPAPSSAAFRHRHRLRRAAGAAARIGGANGPRPRSRMRPRLQTAQSQ